MHLTTTLRLTANIKLQQRGNENLSNGKKHLLLRFQIEAQLYNLMASQGDFNRIWTFNAETATLSSQPKIKLVWVDVK
jgi:hypothetical protein